jgi:hypothetical protein
MMIYTGIGSRETPEPILKAMTGVARYLAMNGYVLRSGGADGADLAFEQGCDDYNCLKEIYLPWENFNDSKSNRFITSLQASAVAVALAERMHPAWDKLKDGGKRMMTRNCYQVLGQNLCEPSSFILTWTKDGKVIGGTGQALRIAKLYEVPVYNLGSMKLEDVESAIVERVENAKELSEKNGE